MKGKKDDSKQVLELLELTRDYLVDVVALAILRAEMVKVDCQGAHEGARELNREIGKTEQMIVASLKEHFQDGK